MKVLIATDGSTYSQKAIEEFCRIFNEKKGLKIKIVSTYEAFVPLDMFAGSAQFAQEHEKAAHEQAINFVAEAAEMINDQLSEAEITTKVVLDFAERFIVDEAKNWQADLIVVGSHGRGFWGRLTLGSVSNAVIHHAPCSVLIGSKTQPKVGE